MPRKLTTLAELQHKRKAAIYERQREQQSHFYSEEANTMVRKRCEAVGIPAERLGTAYGHAGGSVQPR